MTQFTLLIFDDLEERPLVLLAGGGGEDGAQGARGAPLLADDLAEVVGRDAQLEDRRLVAGDLAHLDGVRVVDERPGDERDQILHRGTYLAAAAAARSAFLSSSRIVSD